MKKMNLIKIAPALLLVLVLSLNGRGNDLMLRVPSVEHGLVTSVSDYPVTRVLAGSSLSDTYVNYMEHEDSGLEGWMFSEAYLNMDKTSVSLESWMLDGNYLGEEAVGIEGWMADPEYLDNEAACDLEAWMSDAGYLSTCKGK